MDYIDGLSADVRHLNLLIDDLHQLSMADLGALNYQKHEIEFADFMAEQIARISQLLPKQLQLSWQAVGVDAVAVLGDSVRLEQVLNNLVQNTLNYTDLPGKLVIHVSQCLGEVIIEWSDTAPGVTALECAKLTEPLYRAERSRSRKQGGSGLGLAIALAIVKAHDGSMTASPSAFGGLHWEIRLPILGHL